MLELLGELFGKLVGDVGRLGRVGVFELEEQSFGLRSIHTGHYCVRYRQEPPLIPIRDINPTVVRPVITYLLIAANAIIFLFVQPQSASTDADRFVFEYAAIPCEVTTGEALSRPEIVTGQCVDGDGSSIFPDKPVSLSVLFSMFFHGDALHIAFNMWSLWIFGNNVEEAFGKIGYLVMYTVGGVLATLGYVALNTDSTIPLVGASGAVAAVMGAYLVLFPSHRILSLVFVFFVPVPALLFIGFWFVGQFGIDPASNVAWEAHIAGFLFGVFVALVLRVPLLRRVRAYRSYSTQLGPY